MTHKIIKDNNLNLRREPESNRRLDLEHYIYKLDK